VEPLLSYKLLIQQNRDHKKRRKKEEEQEQEEKEQQQQQELEPELHRESKKQDTELLPITSPNIGRFSKFFHC